MLLTIEVAYLLLLLFLFYIILYFILLLLAYYKLTILLNTTVGPVKKDTTVTQFWDLLTNKYRSTMFCLVEKVLSDVTCFWTSFSGVSQKRVLNCVCRFEQKIWYSLGLEVVLCRFLT